MRQLVRLVSDDNFLFYVFTTPWLRHQMEAEWVNINFERRDLNFEQESYPHTNDFGEICFFLCFWLKKTKCNTFFFHLFNTRLCAMSLNNYCETSYQRWHIRQWFLISAHFLYFSPSLISSLTKQPYSKVGNSRIYQYGNAVFAVFY